MPTSVKVNDLKINRLTEAQYDAAVQAGIIGENELSIITDLEAGQVIQVDTLPTASADELDKIYQYIGTTDQNYTNGYFYKCVSDGAVTPTYSWERINVQPSPDPLPSQSGNAGKFLTTDGTDASWSDKPLVNKATGTNALTILGTATNISGGLNIGTGSSITHLGDIAIGTNATASGQQEYSTAIGYNSNGGGRRSVCIGGSAWSTGDSSVSIGAGARATQAYAVNIGYNTHATATHSIQLGAAGSSATTNSDANTFKVANANGNFEMMSADGTIPEARLADTTSATQGQILTLDSNGNAVWANPASPVVTPQTMPQLTVNGWTTDPNTGVISQTVTVQGVTATNTVFISPYPTDTEDYADAGIVCVSQSTDSLTFTCDIQPSNAITVNVLII